MWYYIFTECNISFSSLWPFTNMIRCTRQKYSEISATIYRMRYFIFIFESHRIKCMRQEVFWSSTATYRMWYFIFFLINPEGCIRKKLQWGLIPWRMYEAKVTMRQKYYVDVTLKYVRDKSYNETWCKLKFYIV